MREKVRALIGGGAGVIKLIVTGAVLTRGTKPGFVELDAPMVEAAVDEAWRQGVYVAAHAHGTEGIKVAIRAGVRSIEHGSLIDDEGIELLKQHGTYLVADVYDGDWIAEEGARAGWPAETMAKNEMTTQAQRDGFAKAVKAGARIAFGTDSGVYPHGRNAIQFGYQVRLGQSPLEADPVRDRRGRRVHGLGGPGRIARSRVDSRISWPSPRTRWPTSRSCASPLAVVKGGVPVG